MPRLQPAPTGLGAAGRKLWKEFVAMMGDDEDGTRTPTEPDARERRILHSACSLTDRVVQLEALMVDTEPITTGSQGQTVMHPALIEIRNLHKEIASLLGRVDLSGVDEDGATTVTVAAGPRSVKARKAAQARWGKS